MRIFNMTSVPKVSVIIPCYNAWRTLPRALESVMQQRIDSVEVIIVDDGSEPALELPSHLEAPSVRLLRQSNQGAAAARNTGIDAAQGEWIAFLDADDYWEDIRLEAQLKIADERRDIEFIASRFWEESPGAERVLCTKSFRTPVAWNQARKLSGDTAFDTACSVWTGTVLVRRELLAGHRFASGLEPAEDRDLWAQLLPKCNSFLLSRPLATAVLEPKSLSRTNIDRDCRQMLKCLDRHRSLISAQGYRYWKRRTYRRWAAEYLGQGRPDLAIAPAWRRLAADGTAPQAYRILARCLLQSSLAWAAKSLGKLRPPMLWYRSEDGSARGGLS